MNFKKTLLATSAVLLTVQPALQPAIAQNASLNNQSRLIIAQAENSLAILNERLVALEAANVALADAIEKGEGVEAAEAAVEAARAAVAEAQAQHSGSSQQPAVEKEASQAEEKPAEEDKPEAKEKPETVEPVEPAAKETAPDKPSTTTENADTEEVVTKEEPPKTEAPAVQDKPAADERPAAEKKSETEQPPTDSSKAEEDVPEVKEPAAQTKTPEAEAPAKQEQRETDDKAVGEKPSNDEQKASSETKDAKVKDREVKEAEIEEAPAVSEQLKTASEKPITILPEEISKDEKAAVEAAEKKRREEARERREELLGAAAVGVAIGALVPTLGGKLIEDEGDRIIIERNGEFFIRRDENALLRGPDIVTTYQELDNDLTQEIAVRPNGVEIVTVRAPNGDILTRERVFPNGDRTILIDNLDYLDTPFIDFDTELPPLEIIDLEPGEYIVSVDDVDTITIIETFQAPPVEVVDDGYSLRQIRESKRLRDKLRRLDLDTVTFDSGSATVRQSQVPLLQSLANAIAEVINSDPSAIFLIEGHTDAVGSELSNLALSDRRAEAIARILIESYGLPAENFVVEGYGEAFLKVDTDGDERQNRRVAVRNISPLLAAK